jgi:hypothetical protein
MPSTSETGHAKNVANLEELISFVNGYGTVYNPSKSAIKLVALNTLLTNARTSITGVNSAIPAYSNAVSAREAAFEPLNKLITRVFNSLVATETTDQVNDSAKTLVRKIQGRRASKKLTEEEIAAHAANGEDISQNSASQMSYDNRLDNLDKLIKLLGSVTAYTPNESDLKVATLTTVYNDLKAKNTAVINTTVPLSNARISRNDVIYKETTGIVSVANDVKAYVKSIYGGTSPQYKQLSALKFTNPR